MDSEKNIKVFCRFRPLNANEIASSGGKKVVKILNKNKVLIKGDTKDSKENKFEFDYIFPENSKQEEVYDVVGKPLVDEVLKGYNATIFAYGQTSSGKTSTMTGYSQDVKEGDIVLWKDPKDMGVVPRLIKDLFTSIKFKKDFEFSIQVSYVEIYLEKIRDLLNPVNENLEIRQTRYKELWIEDVTETYVSSFEDAMRVMRKGEINRTVASTAMNAHSSRSHSVLIVNLNQTGIKTQVKTHSRMIFVDLAGSEKVEKTKAEGLTLKQAQSTNSSLMTLGVVIRALTSNAPHIPYRDSKLTRLLTDSLGGNSKTHLIVTCSQSLFNIDETISTLRFGSNTQKIKNKPVVNLEMNIEEYKKQLLQANDKILTQQNIISALQQDFNKLIIYCESKGLNVQSFKDFLKKRENDLRNNVGDDTGDDRELTERDYIELINVNKELETKSSLITELQRIIADVQQESEKCKDRIEVLQDDLDFSKQNYESKKQEFIDLQREFEIQQKDFEQETRQYEECKEKLDVQQRSVDELNQENTILKNRVSQLVEENQNIRENSLRTWKESIDKSVRKVDDEQIFEKYSALVRSEEEARLLAESKVRHIKVLEDSLRSNNSKIQELASDHKKKCVEYEKKIKDLESQIRILKNSTPPSNIFIPVKF